MESVQKERSNQRGKIFSNFISKDALDVNLAGISDFLPWLDRVLVIIDKVGDEVDQNVLLNQIRRSIKNHDDSSSIKSMTSLNQVIGYIKAKYLIDPRLDLLSLSHLKELRSPQTLDQSLKNISLILPRLKLLQQYNLLPKLSKGILYGLELRSFSQLRLQLYNNSKSLTLDEDKRNDIQSNILASNDNSVITDIREMKNKTINEGNSLDEIVKHFEFFIKSWIKRQCSYNVWWLIVKSIQHLKN